MAKVAGCTNTQSEQHGGSEREREREREGERERRRKCNNVSNRTPEVERV
jgi:hypothetical protein